MAVSVTRAVGPAGPLGEGQEVIRALMAVSAAVAEGRELPDTLGQIAETAARMLDAPAAAIILRSGESESGLAVAGSYGLTAGYHHYLNEVNPIAVGKGPSGTAAATGEPVIIPDVLESAIFGPWRDLALIEHFRSLVSMPLSAGDGPAIGVLNVYRAESCLWRDDEIGLISLLADHAAIAIRTARLLDDSRRQVSALSLIVRSLRTQGHEHANRLHAIHGLLAMNQIDDARRLVAAVQDAYYTSYATVIGRIANATLAGLLLAETSVARQSGIEMVVDSRSRMSDLPPGMDDLDAITVLGNLLHNAVDAVSSMPRSRRRVSVRLTQDDEGTRFRVRDWGPGVPEHDLQRIFERDYTTKDGHAGIGLTLVREVAKRVNGRVTAENQKGGGLAVSVEVGQ